ncbi:hypothetical protein DSD19_00540 [Rhodovulum sp. BSW8]|uniref:Membrane-anchored protein n=1 Tax=Rhodovulum visakhapatnamense TaxID=364297 RepID=A0A4R8FCA2_9RHOB|nr:hypothetical protein [Rhodovulum]RBO55164.1 hypothetical protein DSD19_00540 [Rhodovulum sp. BSW8]TDX23404.1 hypothetical protein EV657_12654 [Rhodovulum visakhapatnamense]
MTAASDIARALPAADDPQPRVNGVYDLPAPGRIAGWAIDRADPSAAVAVEIYREGRLAAKTRADRHRPDLERGGIGTGRYGFSVELDPPVEPGLAFTLSVRAVTGDGTAGALRATGAALPSDDPDRRVLEVVFARVAALGTEIADLRGALARHDDPADLQDIARALDRIELVQARLELAAAGTDGAAAPDPLAGLRRMVVAALALGGTALALGLWSLFAG